jgi:hypothetical protein
MVTRSNGASVTAVTTPMATSTTTPIHQATWNSRYRPTATSPSRIASITSANVASCNAAADRPSGSAEVIADPLDTFARPERNATTPVAAIRVTVGRCPIVSRQRHSRTRRSG